MKKLHLITLILCLIGTLNAQAQPSRKGMQQRSNSHNAKFMVYDFTTKQPIQYAVVSTQKGFELGQTNEDGVISLTVPSNPMEFYSVSAEGYNKMTLRLTEAEKKNGKYEIFLPSIELGYDHVTATASSEKPTIEDEGEKVKIYVKQDPATYQKKTSQGGEILFSVQVAASSNPVSENAARKEWSSIGQVYIQQENGMYKVRIGPFETQQEAKQVLLDVKAKGRKDAFIVVQQNGALDVPIAKPVTKISEETVAPVVMESTKEAMGDYKVRVASYLHPGTFNPDGIDQLGTLESYRKGEWTIMMIGGFKSLSEAKRAKDIVLSKGFTDAAIVVDKDGIIETVLE